MVRHPSERLWAEVVRISFFLHWSLDSVLDLEHAQRQRVLLEIEALRAQPPVLQPATLQPANPVQPATSQMGF